MNDLSFFSHWALWRFNAKTKWSTIRLVVPWKYGFKSIKSIVKISFVEKEPLNTWQKENSNEYGFLCKCKSQC